MTDGKRNDSSRLARRGNRRGIALAALGALAAAALVVRSKTREAERTHLPIGQFIEVDGVRLHYVERGHGQPLVLLHGNGSMIEDLEISGILDQAAASYRVIAFDRPGFGYSGRPRNKIWTPVAQAELLHRALQKLGVERPIVAGHSWGTLVAVALALEFPAFVRSLVLLSGYYYPSVRLDVPLASPPAIPVLGDLLRHTIAPLLGRLMWPFVARRMFSPAPVPARFAAFPVWLALRPSQLRASAAETAMMIPSAMALRRRYHELTLPVAIMAGAADRLVNVRHNSERLHRELAQSDLQLVPDAGHMVHYLAPDQVMAAIDAAAETGKLTAAAGHAVQDAGTAVQRIS